jgi:hypothetical protein
MVFDLFDESIARLHARELEFKPAAAKEVLDELGVREVILEQENAQLMRRGGRLGSAK